MKLDGWPRIILIATGSLLVAIGLVPVIMSGVDDIFDIGTHLIVATNTAIVVLALGLGLISLAGLRRETSWLNEWASGVRLSLVLIGAAGIASAAMFVATIDHQNNTAWRYAAKIETGPGVRDFRTREFGRYFTRFDVRESVDFDNSLGVVPVSWSIWAAGGQSAILVRIPDAGDTGQQAGCQDDSQLTLRALASDVAIAEAAISSSAACGQWQRIEIDMPRGVTALQFGVDDLDVERAPDIDVMLVTHQANMWWLRNFCILVALTILLTVVYVVSVKTRESTVPVRTRPAGSILQRSVIGGAILLFVIMGNAFVYSYVSQEKTIYTWDFSGYWMSTRNVSEFLNGAERKSASRPTGASQVMSGTLQSGEPDLSIPDPGAVAALIRNFRFAEYNVSSNLPVAPVLAVFGGSRIVYELSLLNIYALAAVIMLLVALRAGGGVSSERWPTWWPLIPVSCVFCVVPFWVPILRGYMGISIVGLDLAVLWLYFRQPVREISTLSLVSIGVLLLVGVILQRWNAFWVVAFILMAAVDGVASLIRQRAYGFHALLQNFRVPIVTGFTAFFLFTVVAWPKVVTTVTTDYADIYSAYLEDDNILQAIVRLINAFGGGLMALILAAWLYIVAATSTRRVGLLIGLQLVVMFVHFSGTQTFGPHQMYILMPGLLIILCLALVNSLSSVNTMLKRAGIGASVLVLLSGYASGMAVFAPTGAPHLMPETIRLLSQSYRPPLVRGDLDEFIQLTNYIDTNLEDGEGFYVAAGSQTLSAAHFKNVGVSTGIEFESAGQILSTSIIDKRDGFPREMLEAQLVITSDPIQFSRQPSDQQVIRIPAESLIRGEGIGAAFERLPESFRLDNGVNVLIFRRTRPNTPAEVADLSNRLKVFYPDRPDVYQ